MGTRTPQSGQVCWPTITKIIPPGCCDVVPPPTPAKVVGRQNDRPCPSRAAWLAGIASPNGGGPSEFVWPAPHPLPTLWLAMVHFDVWMDGRVDAGRILWSTKMLISPGRNASFLVSRQLLPSCNFVWATKSKKPQAISSTSPMKTASFRARPSASPIQCRVPSLGANNVDRTSARPCGPPRSLFNPNPRCPRYPPQPRRPAAVPGLGFLLLVEHTHTRARARAGWTDGWRMIMQPTLGRRRRSVRRP